MTSGEDTTQIREGEGFDTGAVERYVREHIDGLPQGELEVEQFPSGASNLTYLLRIRDANGKVCCAGHHLDPCRRRPMTWAGNPNC
jgi:hypothetical protein